VVDLRGDTAGAGGLQGDHAVAVEHMAAAVGESGGHLGLEGRQQAAIRVEHALPVEVEAQLGGQAPLDLVAATHFCSVSPQNPKCTMGSRS